MLSALLLLLSCSHIIKAARELRVPVDLRLQAVTQYPHVSFELASSRTSRTVRAEPAMLLRYSQFFSSPTSTTIDKALVEQSTDLLASLAQDTMLEGAHMTPASWLTTLMQAKSDQLQQVLAASQLPRPAVELALGHWLTPWPFQPPLLPSAIVGEDALRALCAISIRGGWALRALRLAAEAHEDFDVRPTITHTYFGLVRFDFIALANEAMLRLTPSLKRQVELLGTMVMNVIDRDVFEGSYVVLQVVPSLMATLATRLANDVPMGQAWGEMPPLHCLPEAHRIDHSGECFRWYATKGDLPMQMQDSFDPLIPLLQTPHILTDMRDVFWARLLAFAMAIVHVDLLSMHVPGEAREWVHRAYGLLIDRIAEAAPMLRPIAYHTVDIAPGLVFFQDHPVTRISLAQCKQRDRRDNAFQLVADDFAQGDARDASGVVMLLHGPSISPQQAMQMLTLATGFFRKARLGFPIDALQFVRTGWGLVTGAHMTFCAQ